MADWRTCLPACLPACLQRACARGSPNRQELFERRGVFQAPYLEDPNTGVAMFESTGIRRWLGGRLAELRLSGVLLLAVAGRADVPGCWRACFAAIIKYLEETYGA